MAGIEKYFEDLVNKAGAGYVPDHNDYAKGDEIYCGACNKPKRTWVQMPNGEKRLVNCACDCNEAEEKRLELAKRKEEMRKLCFSDTALYNSTFDKDDGKSPPIIESAIKYARNYEIYAARGIGMLFSGGVGNGKTFAVACIMNALIDKGISCKMTSFPSLSRQWSDFTQREEILIQLKKYDVIAIDDFGAERKGEGSNEMVYSIIDTLLKAKKPVIYTTNIPLEEIIGSETKDISTQRIYSRLYEMCIPINCQGPDRRVQKMLALKKEFDSLK